MTLDTNISPDNSKNYYLQAVELATLIWTNYGLYRSNYVELLKKDFKNIRELRKWLKNIKTWTIDTVQVILDWKAIELKKSEIEQKIEEILNEKIEKIKNPDKNYINNSQKKSEKSLQNSFNEEQSLEELLVIDVDQSDTLTRIRELYADENVRQIYDEELQKRSEWFEKLNTWYNALVRVNKIAKLIDLAKNKILQIRVIAFKNNKKLSSKEISFIDLVRWKINNIQQEKDDILQKREVATAYRAQTLKKYKKQLDETGFVITPSRQKLIEEIQEKILTWKNVLLPWPTGTGKTVLAVQAIKHISKAMWIEFVEIDWEKVRKEWKQMDVVISWTPDMRAADLMAKLKLKNWDTVTELGNLHSINFYTLTPNNSLI